MADISNAVGLERLSRVVGYKITKGVSKVGGQNLPMRVAILGPANHANQSTVGTTPINFTSANEIGDVAGYGSPAHQIARILRPIFGGGIGGIPTVYYPQLEANGSTGTTIDVTVSGTPNKNVAHRLIINGRDNVDGEYYEFIIASTDTPTIIGGKIKDAINNVTNAPVTATNLLGVVTIASKWYGATSASLDVAVNTLGDASGLTYVVNNKVSGAGAESIATSLTQFGNEWNTIVLNPYGTAQHAALEAFNGTPSATTPTGRYTGIVFKPFVAVWGSTLSDKDAIVAITGASARMNQVTNVLAPAPNSKGFDWEAAANVILLMARTAQDTPHLDVNGQAYLDMPVPSDGLIGDMADYDSRDYLVKNGASTVSLENGVYTVQDMVTTYRPAGEIPPQFRYSRNLILDWNIRFGYLLLEQANVKDKALAGDDDFITVANVIKPKQWKGILFEYFDDLAQRALITQSAFSKESLVVEVSGSNPDRLNSTFKYKRTGTVRIASTDAEANFAF